MFNAGRRADEMHRYGANLNKEVMANQFGLFDSARGQYGTAMNNARSSMGTGYNDAVSALNNGSGLAKGFLDMGASAWKDFAGKNFNSQGYDWSGNATLDRTNYLNALGLNGQEGNDAARTAFQTGPGFTFAVDQATKAAERQGAKYGMANSGNTMSGVTTLANNLANQEWGNHLGRLGNLNSQSAQIGATMSNADAQRALQAAGMGAQGLAGMYGAMASNSMANNGALASLATNYGKSLADTYMNEGQTDLGIAAQKANRWDNFLNNNLQMSRDSVAGNNADEAGRTGMAMGLANMAMKALGSGSGGGGGGGGGVFDLSKIMSFFA